MPAETCECGHPKSHHWHDRRKARRRIGDADRLDVMIRSPGKCLSFLSTQCRCGRYVAAPEVSDAR